MIDNLGLPHRVEKALIWLDTMVSKENGGINRNLNTATGQLGPISTEITGYALHLYSWLHYVVPKMEFESKVHVQGDWLTKIWKVNAHYMPVEPDSVVTYFFDNGIISRSLIAASKACGVAYFEAVAAAIATQLSRFRCAYEYAPVMTRTWAPVYPRVKWWSTLPGIYQLKAALPWKILQFDDFFEDFLLWANSVFEAGVHVDHAHALYLGKETWCGDTLHPLAYYAEGLYLAGETLKAHAVVESLTAQLMQDRIDSNIAKDSAIGIRGLYRCDVLAQVIRLRVLLNLEVAEMLLDLLCFQSATGGFWFARKDGGISKHMSTHATIFAIQAMVMAQQPENVNWGALTII